MSRCVLDTSICVDLAKAGLLEASLRLSHELFLPDVIISELRDPAGEQLRQLGFRVLSLSDTQPVAELVEKYRKPSTNDLFALACAQVHTCILLSGDADLRRAAEAEEVDVHGVLWILDELVNQRILAPVDAATALERMIAAGSWLPQSECEQRFMRWRN